MAFARLWALSGYSAVALLAADTFVAKTPNELLQVDDLLPGEVRERRVAWGEGGAHHVG